MAIHWASRHLGPRVTPWIGALFAIGSACFFIGPFPGFVQLVGAEVDGMVFFVGSLFFTSAALLQALQAQGEDRLPSLIQFAGTIFFNVNTFRSMQTTFSNSQVDRLIWAPEAAGSACFLISGAIAYWSVRRTGRFLHHSTEWRIAAINLAGCVFFVIATVASYVVPKTGDVLSLAAANWTTALGALCFFIGALLLLKAPEGEPAGG
jgi:hypothetical protein